MEKIINDKEKIKRLNELWNYSIKNFKIYKEIAIEKSIYRIDRLEDWGKISFLDKDKYNEYKELIFEELKNLKGHIKSTQTGGSSSSPTEFPLYPIDGKYIKKGLYKLRTKAGMNYINRNYIHVWGHSHLINRYGTRAIFIRLKDSLKRIIKNEIQICGYNPTKHVKRFINAIKSGKYKWIIGYTSAIYYLARYIDENEINLKGYIDYVVLTSETITLYSIEMIEKVFDCVVIKEYGSAELGVVAYSSIESKKYFFDTDNYHIEKHLVKNSNNDYTKLLFTTFNRVFPLIKYCPDDYFSDFLIKNNNDIICSDVIGRHLDYILYLSLKENKLSGQYTEIFIVHCLKTIKSIAQTTCYVDDARILKKIRIFYAGVENKKVICNKVYELIENEVNNFCREKLTIEMAHEPLNTIAGKSVNYIILS